MGAKSSSASEQAPRAAFLSRSRVLQLLALGGLTVAAGQLLWHYLAFRSLRSGEGPMAVWPETLLFLGWCLAGAALGAALTMNDATTRVSAAGALGGAAQHAWIVGVPLLRDPPLPLLSQSRLAAVLGKTYFDLPLHALAAMLAALGLGHLIFRALDSAAAPYELPPVLTLALSALWTTGAASLVLAYSTGSPYPWGG